MTLNGIWPPDEKEKEDRQILGPIREEHRQIPLPLQRRRRIFKYRIFLRQILKQLRLVVDYATRIL